MLMREKGLNYELKDEPFWERREAFLSINPLGEVPVLVEESGHVICDSYPIIEYLEEAYQQNNFLGTTPGEHAEVRRIISWLDNKFYAEVTRPLLFERYYGRFILRSQANSEVIRNCKHNLKNHLVYFSGLILRRGWLAGERITLADLAAAGHVSCLDYFDDISWKDYPKVKEWYSVMKSRPSLRSILLERISVIKPPAHYEDPDF